MKRIFILLLFVPVLVFAESLHSPTWGFKLNLPEGYEFVEGDGKDQFSFAGPGGAMFDMVVYNGTFGSIKEMAGSIAKKLGNKGDVDYFKYKDKQAAIIELNFGSSSGWGLCVELAAPGVHANGAPANKLPMLLALAYGPANQNDLQLFHFSALDSIIPSSAEQYYPGPITEYSYPRGKRKQAALAASGVKAEIYENDAAAAQAFIEREFKVLVNYLNSPNQKEAWIRYYRVIFRDSVDRVSNAVTALGKKWGVDAVNSSWAERGFASKALEFVQGFKYERNLNGADFLNLVSAVTEGRGDCDSRAMLWAIILASADIPAAMMISPQYSHAMGLAAIEGTGARFELYGGKWLVAETTSKVDIGLIAEDVSDPQYWIGVLFE